MLIEKLRKILNPIDSEFLGGEEMIVVSFPPTWLVVVFLNSVSPLCRTGVGATHQHGSAAVHPPGSARLRSASRPRTDPDTRQHSAGNCRRNTTKTIKKELLCLYFFFTFYFTLCSDHADRGPAGPAAVQPVH